MNRQRLYLVVVTSFLFLFYQNFFGLVNSQTYKNLCGFGDDLVWQKLKHIKKHGNSWEGGFLVHNHHTRGMPSLFSSYKGPIPSQSPYFSQYGLQGRVLGFIYQYLDGHFSDNLISLQMGMILLLVLTWGTYFWIVIKDFGTFPFIFIFILLIGSKTLLNFSHSLYWVMFLQLLPFVTSWTIYPRLKKPVKLEYTFLFILYLIFLAKMLCGYELISCTILSSIAPVIYFKILDQASFKSTIKIAFKIGVTGILSFISALAIHLTQMKNLVGSYSSAIEIFSTRVGDNQKLQTSFTEYLPHVTKTVLKYTIFEAPLSPTATLKIPLGFIVLVLTTLTAISMILILTKMDAGLPPLAREKIISLNISTWFSFFASFSWCLLSMGHVQTHLSGYIHIIPLIFYLPFIPMAYCWIGFFTKELIKLFAIKLIPKLAK